MDSKIKLLYNLDSNEILIMDSKRRRTDKPNKESPEDTIMDSQENVITDQKNLASGSYSS